MLDLSRDIDSLSRFKRKTPEFLERLRSQGRPVVLTINGKAELVVQDAASYQRMLERVEQADRMDALRASLEDMKAGRVSSAEDLLAEMRGVLAEEKTTGP